MANIQNYLNQIKTAVFGKDVRESIHDAIKQCYDDASINHDNANMEVKLARGSHNTLNDRLDENEKNQENLSSQLDTKANEIKSLNDNGEKVTQSILASMTSTGEKSLATGVKELKEKGYLEIEKKNVNGIFVYNYKLLR